MDNDLVHENFGEVLSPDSRFVEVSNVTQLYRLTNWYYN